MSHKRSATDASITGEEEHEPLYKRMKDNNAHAVVAVGPVTDHSSSSSSSTKPIRTSELPSPNVRYTGHTSTVYACEFNKSGTTLASASHDRQVFLWSVLEQGENNSGALKGHTGAVLDLSWSLSSDRLVSASADKTLAIWDPESGELLKRIKNVHKSYVNTVDCCKLNNDLFASGGDDGGVYVWDARSCRKPQQKIEATSAVCAVAMAIDGMRVFSGGLDNAIDCYDLRAVETPVFSLESHRDTVTGLSLSPDGQTLLSNSMDQTLCTWNIRPFVAPSSSDRKQESPPNRLLKTFTGHTHDFQKLLLKCCWSPDGSQISAGSCDQTVNVWDARSGNQLYKLTGHEGAVCDVAWHPTQPILASCSVDHSLILGEY